ncbi:serine/threonine-protein kinase [Streptomyces thermolilacinus]|uniref:non-specific serine/threonine protein kinase n=1 Tax=Streptomyces thermolilacinus SPC6 TaxID=1306406 RepID=A0A1D3DR10_9ACTN|nr:serine/threonine-protein kinase [Streptomyces thermolilacinus]OEJ94775.1 serine/threonine protein kinase [Streptomyces thermolilacinus SPC6]
MEQTQGMGGGLVLAGRYRLGEAIGRGGMGKVWRAHDEVLHRTVAVKELTAGQYVSEADRAVLHARTQKEARAAARITHPAVVTVHDVLEHDGRPWIVMQYVDGSSLADTVKSAPDGRISPREAARIGLHVLGALSAAHAAGVLHRDVKPGNVLLASDGRVLLTDFGIAAIEGDSTITRTGELVGSIDYLAPERVRGADPGPASDLWALGATLYTAVQGESPFRRSSPISTMQAVVTEEAGDAAHAGPLAPVITALLRKDPADRPTAAELERMLLEAMEGRTPTAAQAFVPTRSVTSEELREVADGIVHRPDQGPGDTATAPSPAAPHGPATTVRAGGARWRRAAMVVLLAAAVGAGAGFAVMRYADRPGQTATNIAADPSPSAAGATAAPVPGGVPEGWERVEDPLGFSLVVPVGWKRQMDGDQIDYTPDNGRHRIRVSVDDSPDFENPYMHMLDVEKSLRERLPEYRRVRLDQNTFRDQLESCLWEFTWYEKRTHPGKRHAIDQVYYTDDGTEYALYMSSPEEDWATTREQFDIVLRHWRPAGG